MAILHGNWILKDRQGHLFIWGESWRSGAETEIDSDTNVPAHPLAMTADELLIWWRAANISIPSSLSLPEKQGGRVTRSPKTEVNSFNLTTLSQIIALPSEENRQQKKSHIYPLYSTTTTEENNSNVATKDRFLSPWQVEGFCLKPQEAIAFLTSLPLAVDRPENSWMGGELRFWSQVARWSLDLLSRGKFVPILNQHNGNIIASW